MRNLICLLAFSAMALSAADLSGKWAGSFDIKNSNGETKADTAYMDLKVLDGNVTGTAGPNAEKQWPVQKGKLSGKALTFEVTNEEGRVLVFDLTFDGETIQGTCAGPGDDGENVSATLLLKRAP